VELQQPAGSAHAWDPVVLAMPASIQVLNEWVELPLPNLKVRGSPAWCVHHAVSSGW